MLDFLIVGQGIAGSCLAWELCQAGHNIQIVDNHHHAASSLVAAGMVNPISGWRLSLTANFFDIYQSFIAFHEALKQVDGFNNNKPFWNPKPIKRLFTDSEQATKFEKRLINSEFKRLVAGNIAPKPASPQTQLTGEWGGFITRRSGYVNMPKLISFMRAYFNKQGLISSKRFDYEDLKIKTNHLRWKDVTTRQIIFAEGWQGKNNPWFSQLPWDLVKGDVLTMDHLDLDPNYIVNQGKWMLPYQDQTWRCGSTYRRDNFSLKPDDKGRDEIITKCQQIYKGKVDLNVRDHKVGIRPCTRTQKPFIQAHPEHPHIWIFNGFGSKGALLAPYHAKLFVEGVD